MASRSRSTAELLDEPGCVLFLGDSITWAGGYVEDFETCWRATHPDSRAEILELGLPSETVSGLSENGHAGGAFARPVLDERLERTLERTRPQLVFACYGMNDAIYMPFDESRFASFCAGIVQLEQRCHAHAARLVLLTPPTFDALPLGANVLPEGLAEYPKPFADYDEVLARYSTWLANRKDAEVVDLHTAMREFVAARRVAEPNFTLAGDGVHPGELGHWLIARELLVHFGVISARDARSPEQFLGNIPVSAKLLSFVRQRQQLMRDAWLVEIGHKRPGLPPGLPLDEAKARAEVLEIEARELLRTE